MTTEGVKQQKTSRTTRQRSGTGHKKVKFQTQAPAKSKVYVAGTFNNWDPSANRLRHDGDQTYAACLSLPPGRHEYKFIVDGEWQLDSGNPVWSPNGQGSLNNIIEL